MLGYLVLVMFHDLDSSEDELEMSDRNLRSVLLVVP